jgi:hypothetical protein
LESRNLSKPAFTGWRQPEKAAKPLPSALSASQACAQQPADTKGDRRAQAKDQLAHARV